MVCCGFLNLWHVSCVGKGWVSLRIVSLIYLLCDALRRHVIDPLTHCGGDVSMMQIRLPVHSGDLSAGDDAQVRVL